MGKGWTYHKTKNDHDADSSRAGKEKKMRVRRYVLVDFAPVVRSKPVASLAGCEHVEQMVPQFPAFAGAAGAARGA
jgi:hypothetical protein